MIRLQKFIADAGITSRRKAEELITAGKIKVNGKIVTTLGTKVDPIFDQVEYNGTQIKPTEQKIYLAIHKPVGVISSTSDVQGKTVLDLVKSPHRLFPVGRLDKDSSGLLILTNDGDFANQILHPKFGAEKEYFVVTDINFEQKDIHKLQQPMVVGGKKIRPVKVVSIENDSLRLILHEGVNRQIRRMLGRLGYTVKKLKRIRIGKLELGSLKAGEWKEISPTDIL